MINTHYGRYQNCEPRFFPLVKKVIINCANIIAFVGLKWSMAHNLDYRRAVNKVVTLERLHNRNVADN